MPEKRDIQIPPDLQEGTESMVAAWLKQPGDPVQQHEPLVEISTDKVSFEIAAPCDGVLSEITAPAGTAVAPGQIIGRISLDGKREVPRETPDTAERQTPAAPPQRGSSDRLSPAVRQLIKKEGLDPERIPGSGRGGRITYQDVTAYLEGRAEPEPGRPAGVTGPQVRPQTGRSRLIPHTPMRRKIAAHMVESLLRTAPHVTSVFEVDFSAVIQDRGSRKDDFERRGVTLTYTAYILQAAVAALQTVPEVNSRWQDDGIEVFEDIHIGVATALGREGLVVPVVRNVQSLDLLGVARALQDLTTRARAGKLTSADLEGGTFSVTNHGVSGSLLATPVIPQPQAAILGIGKVEKRVVVQPDDSIAIKPMAFVTLTIDHRVLDGFTANQFLGAFTTALSTRT